MTGWFSGKEAARQCRRHRFDPWSVEQLGLCTTTAEPVFQSLGAASTESTSHNYGSPSALEEPVINHNGKEYF